MNRSFGFPLLLLGALGHSVIAPAQSPGTFSATGNMTASRYEHTATLLNNGKVLIAGGRASPFVDALATAELYDPVTGAFAPTGDMTSSRSGHSATLLPDGRVLIAGGATRADQSLISVDSAELYDPSTGKFTLTGRMNAAHPCSMSTLLNNGKVLLVGCAPGELAELYDPLTGTFAPAGATTPCSPEPVLLSDGKVLLVQGSRMECDDDAYPGFQTYDPDSGVFSSLAWTQWRWDVAGTAKLLPNGKVLMMLQAVECDYGGQTLIYDPSVSSFSGGVTLGYMCLPTGALLSDGSVLIMNGLFRPQAQLYDPVSGMLSHVADMNTERARGRATLLNDGTVLMTGGIREGGAPCCDISGTAELYHPGVVRPPPELLSTSPGGQAAILHASTHQLVSPDNPAVAGEALEIYLTGLLDGSVVPPQVAIGGRLAEVLFFGSAPGYHGLNQINIRTPGGIAPGPSVPVRLIYLNRTSNEVTIGVQ